jgi:hypothetical protein
MGPRRRWRYLECRLCGSGDGAVVTTVGRIRAFLIAMMVGAFGVPWAVASPLSLSPELAHPYAFDSRNRRLGHAPGFDAFPCRMEGGPHHLRPASSALGEPAQSRLQRWAGQHCRGRPFRPSAFEGCRKGSARGCRSSAKY